MYGGVLVFTGFNRSEYWDQYVPKVFIYEGEKDLRKVLPFIINRQKILKSKGCETIFGLIIDTKYYKHQPLNIPDDLSIEVVYTDDSSILKPIRPSVLEFGKKMNTE